MGFRFAVAMLILSSLAVADEGLDLFEAKIRPVLTENCLRCHASNLAKPKGGLSLDSRSGMRTGGDSGPAIVPGNLDESLLIAAIARTGEVAAMPPQGKLPPEVVANFRRWVELGAPDPRDQPTGAPTPEPWWSLRPLQKPALPELTPDDQKRVRTPIDAFILEKLREKKLEPSPEASRQTLIRRLYFDLTGLPPTPEEVQAFLADPDPAAYEKLVEWLLESPRYGERWARHWLDVVRYADTHGYDKDKPRPNAWPYRDYVIRAFNQDKPYSEFVQEQLAGDVLSWPSPDGIEALGFISAGPWDFIGHAEVPESKIDGQIARNLDRDDMVSNTLNTFNSLTVQCARCHDHKFDPVSQDDYYSLQAVFAAVDRADKSYDRSEAVARERASLTHERESLNRELAGLTRLAASEALTQLDQDIAAAAANPGGKPAAFGYHSALADTADSAKWIQLDLGQAVPVQKLVIYPCEDDFNGIGAGFGFPVRFKIEVSTDEGFQNDVRTVHDRTMSDLPKPGIEPQVIDLAGVSARFVRVTATKLRPRMNDFNFALAELEVIDASGKNHAKGAKVSALDSIEGPPRWRAANLNDGLYPAVNPGKLADLKAERLALIRKALDENQNQQFDQASANLISVETRIAGLPAPSTVYAGTVHRGSGAFKGTGPEGKPREIHVLSRGDVRTPKQVVGPGTVPLIEGVSAQFELEPSAPESARRVALAQWLTDPRNPLTWRSIVNRIWHYHFGRGIVDTPNDLGRMGGVPSHPELLEWLAAEFRDGRQSIKDLHRLIVLSSTYRQSSGDQAANAATDSNNQFLWRMNRRRLEAESVRDSVLAAAGKLDLTMGGPGFQDFVVEHPEHSPHYEYKLFDVTDPRSHRRSVYRMIVRSQPQPFMTTLDCADPAMSVDKRNESLTALQALALLNNQLMIVMAEDLAQRLQAEPGDMANKLDRAFGLILSRPPTAPEQAAFLPYIQQHGLANACRALFNLNEFMFVD